MAEARGKAVELRDNAENERLQQEIALLREEMRIKDARLQQIPPQRRPHYAPTERMAIDHYSRRVLGTAVFRVQPTSEQVRAFLGCTIRCAGSAPKNLICDRGCQFDNEGFRRWCAPRGRSVRI